MRIYAHAVYLFLYIPIGIIVLFSFNAGRHASDFHGFSIKWYGKVLDNPFAMEALATSLSVALTTAVLASLFGTMAALALQKVRGRLRLVYDAVIYIAIMIPGIVIGIATLIALVTAFNFLNPALASIWPQGFGAAPRLNMGHTSLIAAHTMFTYVFSSIRRGVTPEINAIGSMVLAVSLTLLAAAQFLLRARNGRNKPG